MFQNVEKFYNKYFVCILALVTLPTERLSSCSAILILHLTSGKREMFMRRGIKHSRIHPSIYPSTYLSIYLSILSVSVYRSIDRTIVIIENNLETWERLRNNFRIF